MKPHLFTKLTISLGIVASAIALYAESSYAGERFNCDPIQRSTTFETERGTVPIIRWTDRSFPPPFTPEQRCQIVSNRFDKFDRNGTLKYLKADRINNLPVLCVAAYKGGSCLPDGLVVTFKPGTDANETLIRILDRRVWSPQGAVQLSSKDGELISEINGEKYFDMELFMQQMNTQQ